MSVEGPSSFAAHIDRSGAGGQAPAPYIGILADICDIAIGPSRELDAQIALALYPALLDLKEVECGVWLEPSGDPIVAPRYSFSAAAARTLIPAGCRIAHGTRRPVEIIPPHGEEPVGTGYHRDDALAILAAALRAQTARRLPSGRRPRSTTHDAKGPSLAKIENGPVTRSFPSATYCDTTMLNLSAENDDGAVSQSTPNATDAPIERTPPFQDIPGGVWTLFISAWGLMFFLFWCFFAGKPEARFVVVIACLFGLMYFGLPLAMAKQAPRHKRAFTNIVQTYTGPLSVNAAAVQIIIIPCAMVVGLTGFILLALP